MWEFRRRRSDLSRKEKKKLKELFEKLPRLKTLYLLRLRFQAIFDRCQSKERAEQQLSKLFAEMVCEFPDLDGFIMTFETWREEILAYFEERKTSGPVEGINNKARVIVKRSYGIKSAETLWTRLILDLNLAKNVVHQSIQEIGQLVRDFKAYFQGFCT